jgi:hypothetical protein
MRNSKIYRELKKLSSPEVKEPIQKWAIDLNRTFQRKKSKWPKTREKILTTPGHGGNANQSYTKILPHSC